MSTVDGLNDLGIVTAVANSSQTFTFLVGAGRSMSRIEVSPVSECGKMEALQEQLQTSLRRGMPSKTNRKKFGGRRKT